MKSFLHTLATYHKENNMAGLPALLLEKGSWFEGRANSDEYEVAKKWKKHHSPQAQDCFCNSQEFCAEDNGARYFEGFVLVQKGISPAEHCWAVMQDGRVVDFTLEALEDLVAEKGDTVNTRRALYVGLEIPNEFIMDRLTSTDWYDSIAELFYADEIQRIANGRQAPERK